MRKKISFPRGVLAWALVPVIAGLIYWGLWFFLPLQTSELSSRFEFWREGVHEVESAGLHGYVRDTCHAAGGNTEGKACSCVVMIHGLADSAMTWKKVLLWPENGWLEPVKLYAFDLPGSGRSPAPSDLSDYRVRKQAEKLRQALAPLCSHWIVVGNSLGGWVGAWLGLDWSEGVSKLLLIDSAGLKKSVSDAEIQSYFVDPTVDSLKEFQKRAYFKGRPLPDHVWSAVVTRMKQSNARQVIAAQTPEDDLDGRLPALRRPTMLLWGVEDRIIPLTTGKQMRSLIPGAIWQEAKDCGHLPQKECPLDVIRAIYNMVAYGAV
jgi:pimeloyl-ACP methyl ester carboxylesterase